MRIGKEVKRVKSPERVAKKAAPTKPVGIPVQVPKKVEQETSAEWKMAPWALRYHPVLKPEYIYGLNGS